MTIRQLTLLDSMPRASAPTHPFRLDLTELFLGLTFVWTAIPETLTEEVYIQDVPLRFVLFYCALFSAAVQAAILPSLRLHWKLTLAAVAGLYMATAGYFLGNDLKFWVIDSSNFLGLLLGIYWTANRSLKSISRTLHWWATCVSLVLIANTLGLLFGVIPQASEGIRIYSYSLFNSAAFLITVFPFWLTASPADGHSTWLPSPRVMASVAMAGVIGASVISATRSMFLTAAAGVLIVLWLRLNGKNAAIWIFAALVGCLVTLAFAFNTDSWREATFVDRLLSTEIAQEHRFLEVQLMFDDLEGNLITGRGFGSRFESCIGKDGEFLAYAPHIAVLTLLYKGGLAVFLFLILLPLISATSALLFTKGSPLRLAGCAGVTLYCLQASMSGGWNFTALFLFGALGVIAISPRPESPEEMSPCVS